ncbi:hypothetical protein [Vibrio phage S4-7]|nr:hypothetical protein [Vibrio phage S4-7]
MRLTRILSYGLNPLRTNPTLSSRTYYKLSSYILIGSNVHLPVSAGQPKSTELIWITESDISIRRESTPLRLCFELLVSLNIRSLKC